MNNNTEEVDHHFIHRSNWLRAAVLGANDGILSTSSLAIGIAASNLREPIILVIQSNYFKFIATINALTQTKESIPQQVSTKRKLFTAG